MDEVSGLRLAVFAAVVVFGAWASWWAKIKALTVPRNSVIYLALMSSGIVLGLWGLSRGAGALGGILAFSAIVAAAMFLFTAYISGMPSAPPGAAVGEKFLDFTASDSDGGDFTLSSLAGRPFLLKFYRGHW